MCAVLAVASYECPCEDRGRETRHFFESKQTVRKAIMEVSDTVEKEEFANVTLQTRISKGGKRMFKVFVIQRQCRVAHRGKNLQRSRKQVLRTTEMSVRAANQFRLE